MAEAEGGLNETLTLKQLSAFQKLHCLALFHILFLGSVLSGVDVQRQ